jgi:hypothetical protein
VATKGELIGDAFAELAIASYVFDLEPEEQQTALRRMDALMAVWESRGIRVGYVYGGGLATESGLPQYAHEPVVAALAVRLAPGFGKAVSAQTLATAKSGYDGLMSRSAFPPEQQLRNLPSGSGNKPDHYVQQPFLPVPTDTPLGIAPGGDLTFTGG